MSSYTPAPLTADQGRELIEHIQAAREAQRISVARGLHDELGASLVSSMMDLVLVAQDLEKGPDLPAAARHLARAQDSLRAALTTNRAMLEEIRPSILDNFGLFAACRWLTNRICDQAPVRCSQSYPVNEIELAAMALTGIFRILEGLLTTTLREDLLESLDIRVSVDDVALVFDVSHEHVDTEVTELGHHSANEMAEILERARALEGTFDITRGIKGSSVTVTFPMNVICRP